MNYKMTNKVKESDFHKIFHEIPHIRQRYNWDCGVTCVLMVLTDEDRNEFLKNFSNICLEEGFSQSTWTIDLCYLLKRYAIDHCMYTTKQSPSFKSLSNSKNITKESERIRLRFTNASVCGLKLYDGVLSARFLISHLMNKGPAIVLVDAGLLSCDICKNNKLTSEFRRILGGSYRGHYIVVIGWSGGKLLYRDPARSQPLCATSPARLQTARLRTGTDCDIILIYDSCFR